MAIYRLWLLSLNDKSIVYSRYFPHLEKKDGFTFPWITPQEFIKCLFISLGIDLKQNEPKTKESTVTINFPYDSDVSMNSPLKYFDRSPSPSSCSLSSMNSLLSTSTMNTTGLSKQISWDSSSFFAPDTNSILKEYLCLYNHLPLIICPIVNARKPESTIMNVSSSSSDSHQDLHQKKQQTGIENLIMLVYEQNGYLFVCCPRLVNKSGNTISTVNGCLENDILLVEEHSISLAYTILQLIASMFFTKNKSIQSLEWFITTYIPFGNLIKTRSDDNVQMLAGLYPKDTRICLRISESISTSFQNCRSNSQQNCNNNNETIFGTFSLDFVNPKLKFSKAEIIMNIDNLNSFSLVLPTNCVMNDSCLIYDVGHRTQYNLNVVHYKSQNPSEERKSVKYSGYIEQPVPEFFKFFRTKYKIYKKSGHEAPSGNQQFIDLQNVFHLSLRIILNDKIPTEEIKFKYFMVKFSLNRGLMKKQVQTMNNSLNNLLLRESMKVSQGQVKNENNSLVWVIGNRLQRKMGIEFDLMITKENLENLDTQCNYSHSFQFKSLMLPKMVRPGQLKLKECKINYPIQMVIPYVRLGKISLAMDVATLEKQSTSPIDDNEYFILDYHLNSFENRLYPTIFDEIDTKL